MSTKQPIAPWNLDGIFVCDAEDNIVCEISSRRKQALANALLIAAAPCMYSLLAKRAECGDDEAKAILEKIDNG